MTSFSEKYECPNPAMLERFNNGISNNFTYLMVEAWECKAQFAMARAAAPSAMRGKPLAQWKLMISSDVSETITHTWGKYEAISGKLQELAQTVSKYSAGIQGIAKGIGDVSPDKVNSVNGTISNILHTSGAMNERVADTKLDAATVYQDSTNRQYVFDIELLAFKDPKREVYDPIKALMKYSCADTADSGMAIKFPAIFRIKSWFGGMPVDVINIENCALQAVLPTWKFPWVNGYPLQASIQLTFLEIQPLYRKTMAGKSLVSTSSKRKTPNGPGSPTPIAGASH